MSERFDRRTGRLHVDNPLNLECNLDMVIRVMISDDHLPRLFSYKGFWFTLDDVQVIKWTSEPPVPFPLAPSIQADYRMIGPVL